MRDPRANYAPPRAAVADPEGTPAPPATRPLSVNVAVLMILGNLAIGLARSGFRIASYSHFHVSYLWIPLGGTAGLAFLAYLVARGNNWARLLWCAFILVGTLASRDIFSIAREFALNGLDMPNVGDALLFAAQVTMYMASCYLLLVPGRAWFRKRKPPPAG